MASSRDDAATTRRRIMTDALERAASHLDVEINSSKKPTATVSLASGEVVEIRHLEREGDRLVLISPVRTGGKDGQFDTVHVHLDDVVAVRIVDDGTLRNVEPMSYDPAKKRLVRKIIEEGLHPTLSEEMSLRELISTEDGLKRIEEAAEASGDNHIIEAVADAIHNGSTRISDLDESHRKALCAAFAAEAVRRAVTDTYRPFIRESEWLDCALERMTSPNA